MSCDEAGDSFCWRKHNQWYHPSYPQCCLPPSFPVSACALILLFRLMCAAGGLRAGARTHRRMLHSLLGAPMAFFDTTLSGRLLNLFTSDMKAIDEQLSSQLSAFLSLIFLLLSVVVMVVAIVPLAVVALLPLFAFYGWIQNVYRNTARELKRFDSTTQSPVFNHFAETLAGLSTIRAFRCHSHGARSTQWTINERGEAQRSLRRPRPRGPGARQYQ